MFVDFDYNSWLQKKRSPGSVEFNCSNLCDGKLGDLPYVSVPRPRILLSA